MKLHKISRLAILLPAALVATVTGMVPLASGQVITTPKEENIVYTLAPGANSAPITIPVPHQAVQVMGNQMAVGFRGVGQVTVLWVPGQFLEWVGLESPSGAAITSGFGSTPGQHVVFLDFGHQVDIQVHTADTFVVHNGSAEQAVGRITLIW
jgi:hypothetical protein